MSILRPVGIGRCCAVVANLATIGAVSLTIFWAEPQRWPLVIALVGALLWGTGGAFAVALIPSTASRSSRGGTGEERRVGTLMYLGRVPGQVARLNAAIAAELGPVVMVVPEGRSVPVGLDPSVTVIGPDRLGASPDPGEPQVFDRSTPMGVYGSDAMARFYEECDAVLVLSARAMPTPACNEAARRLTLRVSWVQGSVEPLNRDQFGPLEGETLDARLRRMATHGGLWCWEPDATMISTSLLREHPLPVGRPMGGWLRERAAEGRRGARVDHVLARRSAPVAAGGYWPDTTARQAALAADLSDAARSRSLGFRARAIAAGLLVQSLSGWTLLWWLVALALLPDGSPVRHGGGGLAAVILSAVVLRWLAPRLASGVRPNPIADLVAGLYGLPGSLAAAIAAVTRRVHPPRAAISTRPLVWLALLATAISANVVLTTGPGTTSARLAAGAATGLLVLTWVFTVRSLVERSWSRVGFRIPLDVPAVINEYPVGEHHVETDAQCRWRLVDGGPGGFALVGPPTGHAVGDEVTVQVPNWNGETLTLVGTLAARRPQSTNAELIGVELRAVEPRAAAWARVLTDAASGVPLENPAERGSVKSAPVEELIETNRWGRRIDRLAVGLVVATSIAVVFTLGLVLVGIRPLVIRSGSMVPTYKVGDVVLVASEQVGDIRAGQVVTRFNAPEAFDSLTHRVRHVTRTGDQSEVETRGDANESSEFWTVPADEHVGVVVASIPAVGRPLTSMRSSVGSAITACVLVLALIALLLRPNSGRFRRHRLGPNRPEPTQRSGYRRGEAPGESGVEGLSSEGFLNPDNEVPTTTSASTIGERE